MLSVPVQRRSHRIALVGLVGALGLAVALGGRAAAGAAEKDPKAATKWISLFDGKSLGDWETAKEDDFSLHGKVEIDDGAIVLKTGMSFTGIVRKGEFPTEDFEIEVEAMRREGIDIFCGLTFPVGGSHLTLVLGGWGDSVVGLSSIDDMNAADNQYVVIRGFKNKQWVPVRLRVTKAKIQAWIEQKQVLDVPRAKHKFTIYESLQPIRPLGFFTWETEGGLRAIRYRKLASQ